MSGAIDEPSPVISVVIPCVILLAARGSTSTLNSDWPSMSMKPGATTRFEASMRVRASRSGELPDRRDAIADDADVGAEPRRAGAVDDAPVGDQDVEVALGAAGAAGAAGASG